jgi:methyl-accepting chemotaxis protein
MFASFSKVGEYFTVVKSVDKSEILKEVKYLKIVVWSMMLLFVILFTAISYMLSRYISKQFIYLKSLFEKAETGDFTTLASTSSKDEMAELGHAFNKMLEGIKKILQGTISTSVSLDAITKQNNDSSITIGSHSSKVADSMKQLADAANEQAQSAEQGNSSLSDYGYNRKCFILHGKFIAKITRNRWDS